MMMDRRSAFCKSFPAYISRWEATAGWSGYETESRSLSWRMVAEDEMVTLKGWAPGWSVGFLTTITSEGSDEDESRFDGSEGPSLASVVGDDMVGTFWGVLFFGDVDWLNPRSVRMFDVYL